MQNNIRGLNDYPFSHAQMMNEVHVNWPPKSIQCNNQSTEIDGCHDNIAKAEIRVHIILIMPLFLENRLMLIHLYVNNIFALLVTTKTGDIMDKEIHVILE